MKKIPQIWMVVISLFFVGCRNPSIIQDDKVETLKRPSSLKVLTYSSYDVSEGVIELFEQENNTKVEFIQGGDAGETLNFAILNRDNPQADVLFGVDNTSLGRALDAELFETYYSPIRDDIRPEIVKIANPRGKLTPVSFGDVCVNYDRAWFRDHNIDIPASLDDLVRDEYKDLLVVENSATSSPGLAFLLTSIGVYGEEGYMDYWQKLVANGVKVSRDWSDAYYSDFTASGTGTRPLIVSYATSPAAEVYYSEEYQGDGYTYESPTGVIDNDNSCFRQVEYVGILSGSQNEALAQKFVDFMLSIEYQSDIPLKMWVFPVREEVDLPEVFQLVHEVDNPVLVDVGSIETNREKWIDAWTKIVR